MVTCIESLHGRTRKGDPHKAKRPLSIDSCPGLGIVRLHINFYCAAFAPECIMQKAMPHSFTHSGIGDNHDGGLAGNVINQVSAISCVPCFLPTLYS
jgi:hypothetical protein